ncbi:MAG: Hsp20 family protein [Rhodospirillaceae bacterium]
MRSFDLSPLFRSTVGFDHLTQALDAAFQMNESTLTYPPYNIEKLSEETYRIALAVAGFATDELEIITNEGALAVRGRSKSEDEKATYLYRGIAARAFERRFQLADYIRVVGARLENGMLYIDLARQVPEALKPHNIPITLGAANTNPSMTQLGNKAA